MSIAVREIISQKEWNDFLNANSPNAFFQSWLWGDVLSLQKETIWRFGFFEGSTLVGIALVSLVTARRGKFLHVRHGPIIINDKKILDKILDPLKKIAVRETVWFVRISPLIEDSQANREYFASLGLRASPIHAMDAEICWVLDLDKSSETLLADMRKTTRYEIKRAQKSGVTIEKTNKPVDLVDFHRLYKDTSARQGFVPHKGIDEEFEILVKHDKALLFLGKHEGRVMAAAIIIFYGGQAIYHHSASLASNSGVNYLLQWEAIMEAKKRGMLVYNFWGIASDDRPNHPWRGLSLFKKGFGGREIRYIHAHDLPVNPLYIFPRAVETIRRFVKGY